MLEKDLRDYFETREPLNKKILEEIRENVSLGINFDGADYLPGKTCEKIINNISYTIYSATEFLHIPLPEVGLIYPWDGEPSEDFNGNEKVLANAILDDPNPNGLISYSPLYLQSVVDFWNGINYGNVIEMGKTNLEAVTAHECYHLWQARVFPSNMKKQTEILKALGHEEWNQTRIEKTARRYEQIFRIARIRQDLLVSKK